MVPIVIAFTPNYFIATITCVNSLLIASEGDDTYEVICLLSEELPDFQKVILNKLSADNNICFRYIYIDDRLDNINVSSRFSKASLYRMVLPDILLEYDKIIYHDCDIIIRQDLAKLYRDFDLGDNYLGVVYEATLDSQYDMVYNVGCKPGKYFNSGFLFMNLDAMRSDNISKALIKEAESINTEFLDQDVLNKVCKDRCIALPVKYNFNRTMILPQYKKTFLKYYSEEDWCDGIRSGNIHYTGGKPWNEYSVMFSLWWDNFFLLPDDFRRDFYISKKLLLIYKLEKNRYTHKIIGFIKYIKRLFSDK